MTNKIIEKKHYSIISNWSALFTKIAFMILFPGLFFYHSLLGLGIIGPVLGGYLSIIALLLLVPLLFIFVKTLILKAIFLTKTDIFVFMYILYFIVIISANSICGANTDIAIFHITANFQFITIYLIYKMMNIENDKYQFIIGLCLVVMTFIVFVNSINGAFYLKSSTDSAYKEVVATYQAFALVYFATFIVFIVRVKRTFARLVIYLAVIPALYLNGARGEFAALFLLIAFVEFYYITKRKLILLVCSTVILIAVLVNLSQDLLLNITPDNRILALLSYSTDESISERRLLAERGYLAIKQSPLLGSYASYPPGEYIHNIFSAWVDLGLAGFLFLTLLLIIPLVRAMIRLYLFKEKSPLLLMSFSLLGTSLFLLVFGKYFTYLLIPAALGSYSAYELKTKLNRKHGTRFAHSAS